MPKILYLSSFANGNENLHMQCSVRNMMQQMLHILPIDYVKIHRLAYAYGR